MAVSFKQVSCKIKHLNGSTLIGDGPIKFKCISEEKVEEDDELAGTWQLNAIVNRSETETIANMAIYVLSATMMSDGYTLTLPYTQNGYEYYELVIGEQYPTVCNTFTFGAYGNGSCYNGNRFIFCNEEYYNQYSSMFPSTGWLYRVATSPSSSASAWVPVSPPTITIHTKLADVVDHNGNPNGSELLVWLKENGTKVS